MTKIGLLSITGTALMVAAVILIVIYPIVCDAARYVSTGRNVLITATVSLLTGWLILFFVAA